MQNLAFYGIALVAVSLYAVLPVIAKKMQLSVPPFAFIAITTLLLASFALLASLTTERSFKISEMTLPQFGFLLLFGFVNFLAFWLYLKALSGMPVAHYQLMGSIGPIVAAMLAFAFLGEVVSLRFFLAIPIILVGFYIALVR